MPSGDFLYDSSCYDLCFNLVNDYIQQDNLTDGLSVARFYGGYLESTVYLDVGKDFNLELFVKPTFDNGNRSILDIKSDSINETIQLKSRALNNDIFYAGGIQNCFVDNSTIPLNTWSHIALVKTGQVLNFYLNGIYRTSMSGLAWGGSATSQLRIGQTLLDNIDETFFGCISNVRFICNQALYTGDFVPPTSLPYLCVPTVGVEVLKLNFNSSTVPINFNPVSGEIYFCQRRIINTLSDIEVSKIVPTINGCYVIVAPYLISGLPRTYDNGFEIIRNDGSGGFYNDYSQTCFSGYIFQNYNFQLPDTSVSLYCYRLESNGDGTACYKITCLATSGVELGITGFLTFPINETGICCDAFPRGIYSLISAGNGCSTSINSYCESGSIFHTTYLPEYSIAFKHSAPILCNYPDEVNLRGYSIEINYCNSGTTFFSEDFYLNLNQTGCYLNGIKSLIADGTGGKFYQLSDQKPSGYVFDRIVENDIFVDIVSNGISGFYLQNGGQTGLLCFTGVSFINLPNNCAYINFCYVAIQDSVLEQQICTGIVNCESGVLYYSDLFQKCSINYFADGTGGYYYNTGFCQSGFLFETGAYLIQLPNLNFYTGGFTGIFSDGVGSEYTGFLSYQTSGTNYYICNFDNCYEFYNADGSGSFLSGSLFCEYQKLFSTTPYFITLPNSQSYSNGVIGLFADGFGERFSSGICYCDLGYRFATISGIDYKSDSTGYYYSEFIELRRTNDLVINWDFDKETKDRYFYPEILTGFGQDLNLSLRTDNYCFYEINALQETNLYINEALLNCTILDDIEKPFLYIRNIGTGSLILNGSTFDNCFNLWCFNENRLSGVSNISGKNYLINSKEGVFLYLKSSLDGSNYLSIACYPFGFIYEVTNLDQVNSGLIYPVINSGTYECLLNYPSNTLYDDSYNQVRSFCFSGEVDNCACINIKFNRTGSDLNIFDSIDKNINFCSILGNSIFETNISLNCYDLILNNTTVSNADISGAIHSFNINKNCEINLFYNLTSTSNKIFKYYYCYSGSGSGDSIHLFNNAINYNLENNQYLETGCVYSFCSLSNLILDFCTMNNFAIKDVLMINKNFTNYYLPTREEFECNYQFCLLNSNSLFCTGLSGNWTDSNTQFCEDFLINYINLIHCSDSCYQAYKPSYYFINLDYSENRTLTCQKEQKSSRSNSESFELSNSIQKCFFYKGLEFRYDYYQTFIHEGVSYGISDYCVPIIFSGSNCLLEINYPIGAVNYDKLRITTEFETIDRLCFLTACACYPIINLAYNFSQLDSNSFCFSFPQIYSENLTGYENPNLNLNLSSEIDIQKNIKFYINPLDGFTCDSFFGLNDFLYFINSEINSGCAYNFSALEYYCFCCDFYNELNQSVLDSGLYFCNSDLNFNGYFNSRDELINYIYSGYNNLGYCVFIEFSGSDTESCVCTGYAIFTGTCTCDKYEYQSTDYNLLFLDLKEEYLDKKYSSFNTGHLALDFSNRIKYNVNNLLPYKTNSGINYNYILPILNCITYVDCFNYLSGNIQQECFSKTETKNLNFNFTGFKYWGGNTGYIYLYDTGGLLTGCKESLFCNSEFNIKNNNYSLFFDSADIEDTISGRCICISKNFYYTGLQPLCFISNYGILDIRGVLNCCLIQYCCSPEESSFNKIFYYPYDFTNISQRQFRIISPESTCISCISWKDAQNEKYLCYLELNNENGILQKNTASINFSLTGLLSNNNYIFNCSDVCAICINIIGDL